MKLRTPLITFERAKISLFLVVYAVLAEYVDPRPFFGSTFSKMLWALLAIEVTRQFWTWRLEVSHEAVLVQTTVRQRLKLAVSRIASDTRYRIRRATYVLGGLYMFGWMLNILTDRCDTSLQCALLFPRLAVESIPQALQIAFYMAMGMMQLFAMFYAMTKVGAFKVVMPGTIQIGFDDVYGQDAAKEKVIEQVALLEDDDRVTRAGGHMPKGVLLWGPPGTGKTMLARAAAASSTKPLILVPPGGFASTFVGINFLKVWQLFKTIRKYSIRHKGVIVFIDEIDALGNRGMAVSEEAPERPANGCVPDLARVAEYNEAHRIITGMGGGGQSMGTLEAFLAAMDGMEEPRGLVNKLLKFLGLKPLPAPKYNYMMIGATNLLAKVDVALQRPGRFGRKIHMTFPKVEGKIQTYEGYLNKVTHALSEQDIEWIARNHYRGTGAEIQDIVNEALLLTFRDGRPEDEQGIVKRRDMLNAMLWQKVGESDGLAERDFTQARTAIHEAGHAVVMHHLCSERTRIWFGSIEQRGKTGGMIYGVPTDEDWQMQKSELESSIMVSLGSRVAEYLFYGEMSNGHGGDGHAATWYARQMVYYGHTYEWDKDKRKKAKKKAKKTAALVGRVSSVDTSHIVFDQLTEDILVKLLKRTLKFLAQREDQIQAIAGLLVAQGTVDGDEIHKVLNEMEAAR